MSTGFRNKGVYNQITSLGYVLSKSEVFRTIGWYILTVKYSVLRHISVQKLSCNYFYKPQ